MANPYRLAKLTAKRPGVREAGGLSREQVRAGRCELHIGAALVTPEPSQFDRARQRGTELTRRSESCDRAHSVAGAVGVAWGSGVATAGAGASGRITIIEHYGT
jgi:hypothetical protein